MGSFRIFPFGGGGLVEFAGACGGRKEYILVRRSFTSRRIFASGGGDRGGRSRFRRHTEVSPFRVYSQQEPVSGANLGKRLKNKVDF
jgi:hypothetical protein